LKLAVGEEGKGVSKNGGVAYETGTYFMALDVGEKKLLV
jgi:hypothetical protein